MFLRVKLISLSQRRSDANCLEWHQRLRFLWLVMSRWIWKMMIVIELMTNDEAMNLIKKTEFYSIS